MIVLKATQEQYDALNGYVNGASALIFAKDGNGDWIVGKSVLNDDSFYAIKEQLLQLEEITFTPVVGNE